MGSVEVFSYMVHEVSHTDSSRYRRFQMKNIPYRVSPSRNLGLLIRGILGRMYSLPYSTPQMHLCAKA